MPFVEQRGELLHSIKIEFNVSMHCNYACRDCSHHAPLLRSEHAALDHFEADLAALEKVYRVQRLRLVGGEPLLHKGLLGFVERVKASPIARQVHLVTNGALLDRAPDELFRQIDVISISWYPDGRCDAAAISRARARCERFDTRLHVDQVQGFRAMDSDLPLAPEQAGEIFRTCQIAHSWYCQTFYAGRFYLCSRPLVTAPARARKGLDTPDLAALDGIELHAPHLRERLAAYLARPEPLGSCSYCLGTVGRYRPWRLLDRDERQHPVAELQPMEALVDADRLRWLGRWQGIERRLLRRHPSIRFARALSLLKNAPYHRSRSWEVPA